MRADKPFFKIDQDLTCRVLLVAGMVLSAFLFLSLRGIVHFKTPDFDKIKTAVAQSAEESMTAADEADLRKNYGILARDLEDFVYFAPNSAMDASEILVLKVKQESSLEEYRTIVKARRETRAQMYRNYRPEEADILDRSVLKSSGSYLIFISSAHVAPIQAAVEQSFR